MNKKRNRTRLAVFRSTAMLLIMVFLLSYATFSWIKREWSPKIAQDNISIQTSGALVFKFSHTGANITTSATVNEILGETSFALKPVSSASGMAGEFFSMEYAEIAGNETFHHLNYSKEGFGNEVNLGKNRGYIVLNFKLQVLQTNDDDTAIRYIFINPLSYIENAEGNKDDIASAIRVSIYCKQSGMTEPIIIGTDSAAEKHCEGVTNHNDGNGNYTADGERLFDTYDPADPYGPGSVRKEYTDSGVKILKTQDVEKLSDYDGGGSHETFDKDKILFQMAPGQDVDVTVCIWLEGEDPFCNDTVTDNKLNLRLQFSAWVEDTVADN